jgi:hypothetical protein
MRMDGDWLTVKTTIRLLPLSPLIYNASLLLLLSLKPLLFPSNLQYSCAVTYTKFLYSFTNEMAGEWLAEKRGCGYFYHNMACNHDKVFLCSPKWADLLLT